MCTGDYALRLNRNNACVTFLTSPASFLRQYGLGPKVNVNCQREVKLHVQLGSLKGIGVHSGWSTGSVASPPSARLILQEAVLPK